MIQNIDYAPTFLEMAGAPVPKDIQGVSLLPLLQGKTPSDWRTSIYYHYYEYPSVHMVPQQCGIRTERYKLIHFYQFDEWELYDLENDPDELANLYNNPEQAPQIAALKKQLADLQAFYGDDSNLAVKPKAWQQQYRK
jgi:arylsulfatase A-like enzyme